MPNLPKVHELVRAQLTPEALARGRKLYLSSAVRELRIDVRRRRYSGLVDDPHHGAVSVRIEHAKDGPSWICSLDGKTNTACPHVAALITAIREREASEGFGESPTSPAQRKARDGRVSLVEHLLDNADRDHLAEAFRLCLKTYPELQGDLVFTILENIDDDGNLYEAVVRLMENPDASEEYTLPREGFDPYRLLDELNYLYEQGSYEQCFLLSRAILTRTLAKMASGRALEDHEVDLTIASSGLLSDLTLPPAPEHLANQVHELGMRLLRSYPKIEPQVQSSLIALIDDESLDQGTLEELEKALRRRWERARKAGRKAVQVAEAESLAMPLALFYARTRQFDKLQILFDRHLQNPLLRAPALAEMLQHNLHEVVLTYVDGALVTPSPELAYDDPEDSARCAMYNDLVMMLCDLIEDDAAKAALVLKAFDSIGHRMYTLIGVYREEVSAAVFQRQIVALAKRYGKADLARNYPALTKYFVVLCELERYEEAFRECIERFEMDPVVVLDYLPVFLPQYAAGVAQPALDAVVALLPLVSEEGMRELLKTSISSLWDIDEEPVRQALDKHFVEIADDELADYVDLLLGELDPDELGL